jgi:hypothetical protein
MSTGTVAITPIPIPGALLTIPLPLSLPSIPPRGGRPLGFEGGGGLGTTAR